ncbi:MAG: YidC/Oxa1 family membrane protein insertase [Candidatus Paceibacterota bacterium]|jgi:YidC/Oxa1 family membrane protein insertase|nr:YidC/Oxa1 family membrane protein insertase [bacterium]
MFEFIGAFFNAVLYQPMLNILVLLYLFIKDFGVAVILLTVLVKVVTHPMNRKAIESQKKMAEIQPKIKELQEKYKDDQQRMAIEVMSLYKLHKFNPFAGIGMLFIQLPIIWALFQVFLVGFDLEKIKFSLYSFVSLQSSINPTFFNMVDLSHPSIPLTILTALVQYYQIKTNAPVKKIEDGVKKEPEIQDIMQKQMTFLVPGITFIVLFNLPSAVALYWMVSSLLSIYEQKIIYKKK